MQILAHNPEWGFYSDETGDYAHGFLIGTKPNDARWAVSKKTGRNLIPKFEGHDFAIIPELIEKPLSEGGGGHYFGQDTKDDLLKGYADNSHGKYHKILGPYSYNDGTDDYFYNAIIKLRNSKAAAALIANGEKTWVPFSVSPHIWPLAGPDDDIYDWEPIGGALVIKGAYGPQAVISKLCKGTAAQCEKSLGASNIDKVLEGVSFEKMCGQKDGELAEIISSIVSKSASIQTSMPENKEATTPQVTTLTAEVAKPNATVESQEAITTAQLTNIVTPEEFKNLSDEKASLEKMVTELVTKDRVNTLNQVYTKIKDDKVKGTLVDKWVKRVSDDDQKKKPISLEDFKEFLNDYLSNSTEEEEEQKKEEEGDKPQTKAKGKSASLPKEPELPKEETSKAASVPVNKLQEILRFQMSGGRA